MVASCRGLDSVCVQWCSAERIECRAGKRPVSLTGQGGQWENVQQVCWWGGYREQS